MQRRVFVAAAVAASLVHAPAADAQSAPQQPSITTREAVVVTATVTPVPFESLARSVWVLTREDLDRIGVSSVIEALRLVPGVDPKARGPQQVQTDFSIRGATFGQSLVLVDGLRINDSQSGHHNGELPIATSGIDRIEVLAGAGSSVHGADALGGTINVITRRDTHATLSATVGQHGLFSAQGSVSGVGLPDDWTATGWTSRSSGFMFDRDYAQGGAAVRGLAAPGLLLDVRHQRRAFGANGFYGASPSKEWTDQTMAAANWTGTGSDWTASVRGLVRNHGDHFRWDINRPGFAENRHRTNAVQVEATVVRDFAGGGRVTAGGTAGGDWVRSSNLGDHEYGHGAGYVEVLWPLADRTVAQAGIRVDGYSRFGSAWSPTLSIGGWLTDEVRLRASLARAFRVPTFTELYYSDPGHLARSDLQPERGWSFDAGLDWSRAGWTASVSPFRRADEDVIDWVKEQPADRWRTTNVRDVTTTGVEFAVTRRWTDAYVRVAYTGLSVDAPTLTLLSKYVLEYARHSMAVTAGGALGGGVRLAVTLDRRSRYSGDSYVLGSTRLSYDLPRGLVFLDVSNLFDETYQEIAGVAMPGRWISAGVTVR